MFRNYLKTAFRNLQRNKTYAFINTLGLSVGIAACFLIFLVVKFESSFDDFSIGAKWRLTGPNNPFGFGLIPFYRFYLDKPDDASG